MIAAALIALALFADTGRADLADLHPVTGPEQPPPVPPASLASWLLVAGGVFGGLGAWYVARRLRRPPLPVPAGEWASRELEALARADWSQSETIDRFAEVVRGYLSRRFDAVRASDVTSELVENLRRSDLDPGVVDGWKSLLNRCDLARFANCGFDAGESAQALRRAQELLSASLPKSEGATVGRSGEAR